MPFRGTGFVQPLPMALLAAATVATMLWVVFTDDKKSAKKTKDASRPRSPRTMMFPKVSFRDFADDAKVYHEKEDFDVIVLEKWVDKYDGPSSAYSRPRLPTESRSWPTAPVAPTYRPAARQHQPRQPDRRLPVKFDPVTTSSIFGDAGFFASTEAMGDVYRDKVVDRTIVHRADSAEFLRRAESEAKGEAGGNSRHSESETQEYYDAPGVPLWMLEDNLLYHDARGTPMMSLTGDTFYDETDAIEFFDTEGLSMWKLRDIKKWLEDDPFFDALPHITKPSVQGQQLGPVQELKRPHVLLMAVLIFLLNEFSVSVSSFANLLIMSFGRSLGEARRSVVSALEYCRFQYNSIMMYRLCESLGGAWKKLVSALEYCRFQFSSILMYRLCESLGDARKKIVSALEYCRFQFRSILMRRLCESLGRVRENLVSALEYWKYQFSFAIFLGYLLIYGLSKSLGGSRVVSSLRYYYRIFQLVASRTTDLLKRPFRR
ncbi:Hypp7158 [Branchiostoma lanceolatum]|uniref:Hypp7158 protein n=1 Tax=Branchiostoma lanceolatum TaxID=7740 RepID=A0A8J9YYD7_BRALA|nr:Hypp7158 [Branchiostoma lanceolatum]